MPVKPERTRGKAAFVALNKLNEEGTSK